MFLWDPQVGAPTYSVPRRNIRSHTESCPYMERIGKCTGRIHNILLFGSNWWFFRVTFVVAFAFLPQNVRKCQLVYTCDWYFVILWMQVDCRNTQRWWDTLTLPAIIKFILTISTHLPCAYSWLLMPDCILRATLWNFHKIKFSLPCCLSDVHLRSCMGQRLWNPDTSSSYWYSMQYRFLYSIEVKRPRWGTCSCAP